MTNPLLNLTPQKHKNIDLSAKSAREANLIYVKSSDAGYSRIRKGKTFHYYFESRKIKDKKILERIKKVVIPPAWENVWICKTENGHLQATGIDKMGRKQYKYHSGWNEIRNSKKFFRLYEFGKSLPSIRKKIDEFLSVSDFTREKILAAVISLMENTSIRIGNSFYEKHYGSFGITTLKNRHVKLNGSEIKFFFTGKKGIKQKIKFKNKKLAKIISACTEIPGKDLFEYLDEEGNAHKIDSGMVNEFIQKISGTDFSAKDFRTWSGSVKAISAIEAIGEFTSKKELTENLNRIYEDVAVHLGNTKNVCKNYYVHPLISYLYENNKISKYLNSLKNSKKNISKNCFKAEEKILMKILKNEKIKKKKI